MRDYIKLMRVKHWIKNGLIFLPFIFSMTYTTPNVIKLILAFFAFSLMASVIYIMNDIRDIEKDQKHPTKCHRPIASGRISVMKAVVIGIILFISSITLNYVAVGQLVHGSLWLLLAYFVINFIYSLGAKNIPILDVVLLSAGFVIRVYYGASVIGVIVSTWLLLTIMSFSLYLGLGKRKKELVYSDKVRNVLRKYNDKFLNDFGNISLTLFIMFYSLWAFEQNNYWIVFSIPILLVIIMQYGYSLEQSDEGDPTTILLRNPYLILTTVIYVIYIDGVMVSNYFLDK